MKKVAVLVLAAGLALALAGCGSSSASSSSASSEENSSGSVSAEVSSSASDVAESSSSAAAASQNSVGVAWKDVATAADAAKGAGFEKFGVMDKITVDDVDYANPTFAYAGGVAQAVYEKGAIGIIVRKADGKHDAPLTDRETTEFAQKWAKSYEGLDVTLYGPAKGAATVVTWSDGTQDFGVTYQGLGGEEVTLDSDDVDAIVKGMKDANAKEQPKQENKSDDDDDDDSDESEKSAANMTISQGDAEAAAEDASGGETVSAYQDYVDGHGWVWVITTNDKNGNEITYYVDNYGNAYNAEFDSNSSTELSLSEGDACAIAEDASGGKATNAYPEQTENHGLCWHVSTEDDNGNKNEYHVDNDGNAFNIEFE